jgi:hypothetical protein
MIIRPVIIVVDHNFVALSLSIIIIVVLLLSFTNLVLDPPRVAISSYKYNCGSSESTSSCGHSNFLLPGHIEMIQKSFDTYLE